jgi:hypothetical protein
MHNFKDKVSLLICLTSVSEALFSISLIIYDIYPIICQANYSHSWMGNYTMDYH